MSIVTKYRTDVIYKMIVRTILIPFLLFALPVNAQVLSSASEASPAILNKYILDEVNKIRKKAKVDSLEIDTLLNRPSADHARYMAQNKKITHYQNAANKKTPKNRTDFYGAHFAVVGENVQFTHSTLILEALDKKKKDKELTYQNLAYALVQNWKNSPPHYKNMIDPNFKTTTTSVSVGADGNIYACQLFGSPSYTYPKIADPTDYPFKPQKDCKCRRVGKRPPVVTGVFMDTDSVIWLYSDRGRKVKRRIRNFGKSGFSADVILKSQYSCDDYNRFNGVAAVRGIPLDPVFSKDFRKGKNFVSLSKKGFAQISLGKLPSWVNEEYEINVTVVKRKRTCLNMRFQVMPLDFKLKLAIPFSIDTVPTQLVAVHYDTLSTRVYYSKSASEASVAALDSITKLLEANKATITQLDVKGLASIEGSTQINTGLYKKRAQVIVDFLDKYSIDTALVTVTAEENFNDFRRDIKNSAFSELGKLSDEDLKRKLEDPAIKESLEPLLKNHRYAQLTLYLRREEKIEFNKEQTQALLQQYIDKSKTADAKRMQSIEFGLAMRGDIVLSDVDNVTIPHEKKFLNLINNRAVMKYYMDSANKESLNHLRAELETLYTIDSSNRKISTNLALIQYMQSDFGSLKQMRKYYTMLGRKRNIDPKIKSRMLIDLAAYHDWTLYSLKGFRKPGRFLYNTSKRYIKPSKFSPEETFDVVGYYVFFHEDVFAYQITKDLITKTNRLSDLLFFLKLIHMTNLELPRKTYLRLFKKIQKLSGKDFCTLFNSPAINFQIFDDLEIKEIYCEQCAN
ncbi:MAG: CAP domain-containing protein [Flavobacteriales bacterium]